MLEDFRSDVHITMIITAIIMDVNHITDIKQHADIPTVQTVRTPEKTNHPQDGHLKHRINVSATV